MIYNGIDWITGRKYVSVYKWKRVGTAMRIDTRITILAGHFGSGKTELALNLALRERKVHEKVAIADLDVINPYFRSRDVSGILTENGIELIGPSARLASSDLPVVSGEIYRVIHDPSYRVIIDAGGEKDGATVLGQYYHEWKDIGATMLFVLNANRPYVSTEDGAIDAIKGIEKAARLRVSGIINNTNLGGATAPEDILKGDILSGKVARSLDIPVLATAVSRQLEDMSSFAGREDLFVIDRFMKLPWE
ncbi:ATP-binding protein [Bacillus sp. FJAT-27445]|uniref:ATP-binding protein n=1 Tax=Bacillus sp. FJAT-27445 TaxID=1679166 RepID=UPI0007435FEA|nr:ATP-binding protein [Bacillus sp. FJAT-27445]